ncbi:MAG: DUF4358 domain-containing protein [Oscillospiraceae bacterium]|nr:DUF4358 domain-containing protein [Oscillospiraceae bacterium]
MKKMLKILALSLCLLLALSACGSSSYISFDDVYNDLTTEISFGANMAEMSEIAAENFYFIYDTDILEDYVIYMDESNATPNEIALFRLAKESDRTTVETIVQNRIKDLKIGFEDYNPDEMYKLENAVVKSSGKYVMMVICSDNSKAAEILNGYLK